MPYFCYGQSMSQDFNAKRRKVLQRYPNQPRNIDFAIDPKSKRRFLPGWFDNFPWLEWDSQFEAAFCAYSVDSLTCSKADEAFVIRGFKNWKKAQV